MRTYPFSLFCIPHGSSVRNMATHFKQLNEGTDIMATYHFSIKSGRKGTAHEHANYIARNGKHGKNEKKEDLIALWHGNLPEWAHDSPAAFWKAADNYERSNGTAYREFELALPVELTRDQQWELAQEFIERAIGHKPYQAAIHAPTAAIGKSPQPHAHVMLSDRIPDGIARSPEQHFRRYNARAPEKGGAKKDSGGKEPVILKEETISLRALWAEQQNELLEKHGHSARVDHRSYRDRGIDKEPERHLGSAGVKSLSDEEKLQMKKRRRGQ